MACHLAPAARASPAQRWHNGDGASRTPTHLRDSRNYRPWGDLDQGESSAQTQKVYRPLANAIGFALAAQLNFALSARLTWRDRSSSTVGRGLWTRWLSYNGTALISLAVNTAVFTIAYHRLGNLAAAALGVLTGMCVTYLVCDLVIFRDRAQRRTARGAHRRVGSPTPAKRLPAAASWDQRPAATSWDQP